MPSTPTTRNRFEKMVVGAEVDTWGDKYNTLLDLVDEGLSGKVSFTLSGSKTLTATDYVSDEARKLCIDVTSGTGGTVTIPATEKLYVVRNGCSGIVTISNGSGVAVVFPGMKALVYCSGSGGSAVSLLSTTPIFRTISTLATTSGTTATFETANMEYWREIRLVFEGVGHSTAGATSLRIGITTTPATYSTMTVIGSFAGAATLYGTITISGQTGVGESFAGAEVRVAVADLSANMTIGATAGGVYGMRYGNALNGVRVDFNGATFDSGSILYQAR